jgi:hypothetical protein
VVRLAEFVDVLADEGGADRLEEWIGKFEQKSRTEAIP